jgi:hypothetical protein
VVHGDLHSFAEWPLGPACAPAVRDIAAPRVQPLSRAVLVEQADRNAQRGDAPLAGQLLGCVYQECGHALPPERPGHGELVDQRNAAVPEPGEIRLPQDRDITGDVITVHGDKAGARRFAMIG